jgi:hypothetical protein
MPPVRATVSLAAAVVLPSCGQARDAATTFFPQPQKTAGKPGWLARLILSAITFGDGLVPLSLPILLTRYFEYPKLVRDTLPANWPLGATGMRTSWRVVNSIASFALGLAWDWAFRSYRPWRLWTDIRAVAQNLHDVKFACYIDDVFFIVSKGTA